MGKEIAAPRATGGGPTERTIMVFARLGLIAAVCEYYVDGGMFANWLSKFTMTASLPGSV